MLSIKKAFFSIAILGVALCARAEDDRQSERKHSLESKITKNNFTEDDVQQALIYNDQGEVIGISIDKMKHLGKTIEINEKGHATYITPDGPTVYDADHGVVIDHTGNAYPHPLSHTKNPAFEQLSPLGQFAVLPKLHGFNETDLAVFKHSDLGELITLLHDDRWKREWAQIAVVLGMLGGPNEVDELIRFIRALQLIGDDSTRIGQEGAYHGLGYLAANTQSGVALQFLLSEYRIKIAGKGKRLGDYDERFIIQAIERGLAQSVHPKAIAELEKRKEAVTDVLDRAYLETQLTRAKRIVDRQAKHESK